MMFFFSRLVGQTVRGADGRSAGRLQDLIARVQTPYPVVTALVLKRGRRQVGVPWTAVASFEESGTLLRAPARELEGHEKQDDEILLSGQVLDKQIVDTEGHKIIRVNDIQLARVGAELRIVAVDVSSGAILRRIGLSRVAGRISRPTKPTLIDWRNVDQRLSDADSVKLTVPRTDLSLLHPADIADIAHELSPEERAAVFEALEDEVAADAVEEMHPSFQASLIQELPDEKARDLLSKMDPDDAADLLADLPPERAERLIAMMAADEAEDVRELLAYPEHSAGGIMTTEYASVGPELTAGEAIERLREQEPEVETVYYVYVVDRSEHLRGVFSLRDLLTVSPERRVREFMNANPVSVTPAASEEAVTGAIAKYNLLALPVVDDEGVLHGIITVDDAIDLVLPLAWKKRLPRIFH
jgi:magnesium transporter